MADSPGDQWRLPAHADAMDVEANQPKKNKRKGRKKRKFGPLDFAVATVGLSVIGFGLYVLLADLLLHTDGETVFKECNVRSLFEKQLRRDSSPEDECQAISHETCDGCSCCWSPRAKDVNEVQLANGAATQGFTIGTSDDKTLPIIWNHAGDKEENAMSDPFRFLHASLLHRRERGIFYDARGHGISDGFENADEDLQFEQFTWERLSEDMDKVARDFMQNSVYVAGGRSTGAALALWAAVKWPSEVKGVIVWQIPPIWESREAIKYELWNESRVLKRQGDSFWKKKYAEGKSDIPNEDEVRFIKCPVLIITSQDPSEQDRANRLQAVIGKNADLVTIPTEAQWPWKPEAQNSAVSSISDFMHRVGRPSQDEWSTSDY